MLIVFGNFQSKKHSPNWFNTLMSDEVDENWDKEKKYKTRFSCFGNVPASCSLDIIAFGNCNIIYCSFLTYIQETLYTARAFPVYWTITIIIKKLRRIRVRNCKLRLLLFISPVKQLRIVAFFLIIEIISSKEIILEECSYQLITRSHNVDFLPPKYSVV